MRSIICNCCWSGFLYKHANKRFDNPFFWSRIYTSSFTKLLKNFFAINFCHVKMCSCDDDIKFDPWSIKPFDQKIILTDYDIHVTYHHYHYSVNDIVPRRDGVNIYYNKHYELVFANYMKRAARIPSMESPIWLYLDNEQPGFSSIADKVELLKTAASCKRPLIYYTEDESFRKYETETVKVIVDKILSWDDLTNKYFYLFD